VKAQFLQYIPADVPRPLPTGAYMHLHNVYLQYAAERGVPALARVPVVLGKMLWDFLRAARRLGAEEGERRFVLHGALAVMIALLSAGWYEHNLNDGHILTWLFLAVLRVRVSGGRDLDSAHVVRLAETGPVEAVEGDQGEADHGHGEAARHIPLVGHGAHEFRQDGAAHDGHDDEGRRLLRTRAQAENAQREDGGEHDRHEEVAGEHADTPRTIPASGPPAGIPPR
jgi:hypothetical protein